jgi:excinuclease ABC subunit A
MNRTHGAMTPGASWVIDIGPGAWEEGGRVVVAGPPAEVTDAAASQTAPYLARYLHAHAAQRTIGE